MIVEAHSARHRLAGTGRRGVQTRMLVMLVIAHTAKKPEDTFAGGI